jgi:two-component system, sensor histidine kinase
MAAGTPLPAVPPQPAAAPTPQNGRPEPAAWRAGRLVQWIGGHRRSIRARWLTLSMVLLALAVMLALLYVVRDTLQHQARFSNELAYRGVYGVHPFHQLEIETTRLGSKLGVRLRSPEKSDPERLWLQYELFVSRIDLVRPERSSIQKRIPADLPAALVELDAFVARADAVLGSPEAAQAAGPEQMAQLLEQLRPLRVRVRSLVMDKTALDDADFTALTEDFQAFGVRSAWILVVQALAVAVLLAWVIMQVLTLEARHRRLFALARRLRQARSQLRQALEAKSAFLANMSHEIRTPFQGILGRLSLLDEATLDPLQREHVRIAQDSAQQLLVILNDILDLTRLDVGALKIVATPCNVPRLVNDTVELMRPLAQDKRLALTLRCDVAPGTDWLLLDGTRLRQVLTNLLSNAVKFTDQGSVEVVLEIRCAGAPGTGAPSPGSEAGASPGCALRLTVRDTGIGIESGVLERIFERFVQADLSVRRQHGGAGIGLDISRRLAELMGGRLAATSELHRGSEFVLTMPVLGRAMPEMPKLTQPAQQTPPPCRGRLLVAEDNATVRGFLALALRAAGYEVTFAEDGVRALQLAEMSQFDLVLMDVHMPGMDGLAATRTLRRRAGWPAAVPIVMMTADVMPETRRAVMEAGATEMVIKPVRKATLIEALQRAAGNAGAALSAG